MALSFPLTRSTFFAGLKVIRATFSCPAALETSQTGGGEIITADLGPRLWHGNVTLARAYHREAEAQKAVLSTLRQAGRSFMAFNPAIPGPANDPSGTLLSGALVKIATLATNNRELSLDGLPVGFELVAGDMLSFDYGAFPTRYALHQVVTGANADASGLTGQIEVTPNIRPGAAVGASVSLYQPWCKAVLVPGSVNDGEAAGVFTTGITFKFIQTLR